MEIVALVSIVKLLLAWLLIPAPSSKAIPPPLGVSINRTAAPAFCNSTPSRTSVELTPTPRSRSAPLGMSSAPEAGHRAVGQYMVPVTRQAAPPAELKGAAVDPQRGQAE